MPKQVRARPCALQLAQEPMCLAACSQQEPVATPSAARAPHAWQLDSWRHFGSLWNSRPSSLYPACACCTHGTWPSQQRLPLHAGDAGPTVPYPPPSHPPPRGPKGVGWVEDRIICVSWLIVYVNMRHASKRELESKFLSCGTRTCGTRENAARKQFTHGRAQRAGWCCGPAHVCLSE